MLHIASRLNRIKPSPSSMAGQRARALRAEGRDIVGLTAGEPDFDTPAHIREAATRAMTAGQTRYTDVGGTAALREAIREKFARENGLDYNTDEVIVSAGAKQIIFNAFMCTLEAGDEVIVPAPYWVSYPDIALLADGVPVIIEGRAEQGFKLQPDALERAITPRTRWLVLNGPNNPSGANYSRDDLVALAEVLNRHPHVWVLTDDIYEHLLYDGRSFDTIAQVAPELKERTLTINGVSKAYAMTGWRIGYAGAPAALIKAMTKLQSQSTSNPASVSQAAALAALTGPQDFITVNKQRFETRRNLIVDALNQIDGITCARPDGAFYVFPSCDALFGLRTPEGQVIANSDDWVMHLLNAQNLAVLQGSAYGIGAHFRISFAANEEKLLEGCRRIALARAQLD
ncbi:pyridoxal phosphate-dependent aminotransferase [Alcaligenaceae bacterium C4P045]|nr:pyridoxal phosphate-dependent aminotransferase [Alcaligenaceae bacterium C4P045]